MIPARLSPLHRGMLTLLRMAIGWHLLYEGVVKLSAKAWSSAGYLTDSTWVLAPYFRGLTESSGTLRVVDALNVWGLTLLGLALVLGLFTRLSAGLSALLIALYYLANPPFIGLHGPTGEGSYLVINKNLIEVIALLLLLLVPRGWMYGLDGIIGAMRARRRRSSSGEEASSTEPTGGDQLEHRRRFLMDLAGVPVLGAFWYAVDRKRKWDSIEEKLLIEAGADAITAPTLKHFTFSQLQDLRGTMTYGRIGSLKVSRLILGGNLIGGWAHSRDLLYVSKLVKAYHTDERVIATLRLAEKCGINTLIVHPKVSHLLQRYWDECGGRIQFFADCGGADLQEVIRLAVRARAHACYVQGETADRLVREGRLQEIPRALDLIRSHGLPAGIGAHRNETVRACVDAGIHPDFWMKTLHHERYWSARTNDTWNDNRFCFNPEETISLMTSVPEPWIGFKVLAAGAIPPEDGFGYAFSNGADFIAVGMYDFQIVDDVNLAVSSLAKVNSRKRPWRA